VARAWREVTHPAKEIVRSPTDNTPVKPWTAEPISVPAPDSADRSFS
jgi:hypothetical protein